MTKRIMAVALVAVSLFAAGASQAQAQEVQLVRIVPLGSSPEDDSWAGTNRTIIIIGLAPDEPSVTIPVGCGIIGGQTGTGREAVVIQPGQAALRLTMYALPGEPDLSPGSRITDIAAESAQCCINETPQVVVCSANDATGSIRKTLATIQNSASAGAALFSSPVALDADAIGVVTGQPNDDGTYRVIFKKQGSPAQQVDIASYYELLPADVLRDLIDLGQDPDTGEHLYLAFIEW